MSAGLQGTTRTFDQPWYDKTGLIKLLITLDSTVVDARNSSDTATLRAGLLVAQKSGAKTFVNANSADIATAVAASIQSAAFAAWGGLVLAMSDSEGDIINVTLTGVTDIASTVTLLEGNEEFDDKFAVVASGTNQMTITSRNELMSFNASISTLSSAFSTNEAIPTPVKYGILYDNNVVMRGPQGPVQDQEAQVVFGGGVAIVSRLSGLDSAGRAYLIQQKTAFKD